MVEGIAGQRTSISRYAINAPEMKYALFLLGRSFLRDKFVTGYWAWELPIVPKTWDIGFGCCA